MPAECVFSRWPPRGEAHWTPQRLAWTALFATTRQFLDDLGLASLEQLPTLEGAPSAGAMLAEVLPQQKLEMVDELKSQGHRVAVIGDGVNDAPALAAGDISIAMGAAGSDVAIHSARIALMNNNLNRIPFLIRLSRMTSSVIRQNLAIGVFFIVVGLAAAAMGYISGVFAALVHVGSGFVVIFNSARLVRTGEEIEHAEAAAMEKVTAKARPVEAPAGGRPATA